MCILFSDHYGATPMELAVGRTLATVPFGGRYRLIDFILSSLVKARIFNVGVLTKERYGSLVDHLGGGKDWDLDRKKGGLKILTPFVKAESEFIRNRNKVEALISIASYLESCSEEHVILADSNLVMNIDFEGMQQFHIENDADITLLYQERSDHKTDKLSIGCDPSGKVVDAYSGPSRIDGMTGSAFNVAIFKKSYLLLMIARAHTFGWNNLERDFITRNIHTRRVFAYRHTGFSAVINTTADYYRASMQLLDENVREELFYSETPILTRIKNSVPTVYGFSGKVKNSLIADGCEIHGKLNRCIVFRDVVIKEGAVLNNCIIMQQSVIEEGAELNCIITDKNVSISQKHILFGYSTYPFIIAKGQTV